MAENYDGHERMDSSYPGVDEGTRQAGLKQLSAAMTADYRKRSSSNYSIQAGESNGK